MGLNRSTVVKALNPSRADLAQAQYKDWYPRMPSDLRPTLEGAPDDLPMREAAILHTQASRWLEYLKIEVAKCEAAYQILQQVTKAVTRKVKFMRGNGVDKWELADVEEVNGAEEAEVDAEAKLILLKGILDGTEKVRLAASRAITRHEKMNTDQRKSFT